MTRGFDPATNSMREPWMLVSQIEQLFEVRSLSSTVSEVDADIDVLMVVHPKGLSDDTLYALDQFVMRGGRMMVFVDPHSEIDQPAQDPANPTAAMFADRSSDLGRLFAAWGVNYQRAQILLDASQARQMASGRGQAPVRHLAVLGLTGDSIDAEDVTTSGLSSITLSHAGVLSHSEGASTLFQPLLRSSDQAMLTGVDRVKFLPDPNSLFQGFAADGSRHVIAARVSGAADSAFPERESDACS